MNIKRSPNKLNKPTTKNKTHKKKKFNSIKKIKQETAENLNDSVKEKELLKLTRTQEIIEASKKDKVINEIWEKIRKGKITLDEGYILFLKVKNTSITIRRENISKLKKTDKRKKNNVSSNTNKSKEKNSFKQMNICKGCSKATFIHQESICEECGHLNTMDGVLCDDDYENGFNKLREPNAPLCKNSPNYDLITNRQLLKN